MERDKVTTDRLRALLAQLISLTRSGELHWDREQNSAHRYGRWKNNLLILGPAEPLTEAKIPRYLFITPFDSPACVEINSQDQELGEDLMALVNVVEQVSRNQPAVDPFGLSDEVLNRLS